MCRCGYTFTELHVSGVISLGFSPTFSLHCKGTGLQKKKQVLINERYMKFEICNFGYLFMLRNHET